MKYSETGFRPLYHNFCIFPMNETIKVVAQDFPEYEDADGVLTYGYCDRMAGFTLELLCCVKRVGDSQFALKQTIEKIRGIIRIGSVADEEYEFVGYGDNPIKEKFERNLEVIAEYDADEEVETSRTFELLDIFRHELYPDDVIVFIIKNGLKPEGCWFRINDLSDRRVMGTLLNEPNQDFGYHAGDTIAFFICDDVEGNKRLISDLN